MSSSNPFRSSASSSAHREFEEAFRRPQLRSAGHYRRLSILRIVVLVLLFAAAAMAVGWGYNTRVAEECQSEGGRWFPHEQVCQGPDGEISLALSVQ